MTRFGITTLSGDDEVDLIIPPISFEGYFPYEEERALDMFNVLLKIFPDPNVVAIYKHFCKFNSVNLDCFVHNLHTRYDPEIQ